MTDPANTLLEARAITKSFAQTRALVDARLSLRPGVTHALLGANGAGKSTLSRVISGHVRRDAGEIVYGGRPLDVRSPREALDAGIAMVMQETSLAPDLSVLENIFLPDLGRPGRLSRSAMRRRAGEILADLGQEHALPLDVEARDLSAAQRQLVEIAKALALQAKLIIFDEPTASLSPSEVERLFDVIGRLEARAMRDRLRLASARGSVCDLRRDHRDARGPHGRRPHSRPRASIRPSSSGSWSGATSARSTRLPLAPPEQREARPFSRSASLRAPPLVRDVSFDLHRGEILGLGGLVGAGRSETVETLFGLRPRAGGEVRLEGRPFAPRAPAQAIRAGIGFVAEDRRRQSIVPDLSVRENLLLGHLGAHRGFGLGYGRLDRRVAELMRRLELPSERLGDPNLLNFSGGMQQKIIIARWLLLDPKVLILDEPTKGVDIGTRASIYAILRDIAAQRHGDPHCFVRVRGAAGPDRSGRRDQRRRLDRRCAERLSRRGEADPHGRAAHLDGAQSPPFAGTRRPVRRRGVLGDPRP